MNNELTQTLQLDGHIVPGADVQRLVDGLVQNYEKRAQKAKVVQLDHTHRTYAPVLDLDASDAKPAEEDVLSARIFPMQEQEEVREALMKELDAAVENYANAIVAHSKTLHAFSVRAYFIMRSIARTTYFRLRSLGTDAYRAWQARRAVEHEHAVAISMLPVADIAPTLAPVYATTRVEATHVSPPETLTYTYGSLDALYAREETPPVVLESTAYAVHTETPDLRVESDDSPASMNGVARCLYLQFRYGPINLRK